MNIDLFNAKQVNSLANTLKEKKEILSYVNFTNLGGYYDLTATNFLTLPFSQDVRISSVFAGCNLHSSVYIKGAEKWLDEYKIREMIYRDLHRPLHTSKEEALVTRQITISAGVTSGNLDCINTPNAKGISPLRYYAIEKPNLEKLTQLFQFPVDKNAVSATLQDLQKVNPKISSFRHKEIIAYLEFEQKYSLDTPNLKAANDNAKTPHHYAVNKLTQYIQERAKLMPRGKISLSWNTRNLRNYALTTEKLKLVVELQQELLQNKPQDGESLRSLLSQYKAKNKKLEDQHNKHYFPFFKSSLEKYFDTIDAEVKSSQENDINDLSVDPK